MKPEGNEKKMSGKRVSVPFVAVIFFLMLLYLLLRSLDALRGNSISAYNVGSPAEDQIDHTFTGMILRDEKIYTAKAQGTVQYYRSEGERVSQSALLCVIDRSGTLKSSLEAISDLSDILTDTSYSKIREEVNALQEAYDPRAFSTAAAGTSSLKGFIYTRLLEDGGEGLALSSNFVNIRSQEAGFLLLSRDGYERLTPEDLIVTDFSEASIGIERRSGSEVKEGEFLYKLAADNRFELVFPLTDAEVSSLSGRKTLSVTMPDDRVITGSFSLTTLGDGTKAGVLNFQKYGLNYLDSRLITFRLADQAVTGYKIPLSSLVQKSFFVVPSEFVTSSGSDNVVLVETGDGVDTVRVSAYGKGSDDSKELLIGDGVTYIMSSDLKAGSVLLLETRNEETGKLETKRETLGVMATLEGVYQINKGYCVFKPVLRLQNSVESSYIMVSANLSYGLKSFDRIVLDASGVKENEIVY